MLYDDGVIFLLMAIGLGDDLLLMLLQSFLVVFHQSLKPILLYTIKTFIKACNSIITPSYQHNQQLKLH